MIETKNKISWKVKLLLKFLGIKVIKSDNRECSYNYQSGEVHTFIPKGEWVAEDTIAIDTDTATDGTLLHEIGHCLSYKQACCFEHWEIAANYVAIALSKLYNINIGDIEEYDSCVDRFAITPETCSRLERREYYMGKNELCGLYEVED